MGSQSAPLFLQFHRPIQQDHQFLPEHFSSAESVNVRSAQPVVKPATTTFSCPTPVSATGPARTSDAAFDDTISATAPAKTSDAAAFDDAVSATGPADTVPEPSVAADLFPSERGISPFTGSFAAPIVTSTKLTSASSPDNSAAGVQTSRSRHRQQDDSIRGPFFLQTCPKIALHLQSRPVHVSVRNEQSRRSNSYRNSAFGQPQRSTAIDGDRYGPFQVGSKQQVRTVFPQVFEQFPTAVSAG
mmetsp:Transcript_25957/g.36781  ORF Transcript_25957/g.36781 Transcript_25957/m.36781 type:complete len:244 (-) Transcript_25957:2252-2983(-)